MLITCSQVGLSCNEVCKSQGGSMPSLVRKVVGSPPISRVTFALQRDHAQKPCAFYLAQGNLDRKPLLPRSRRPRPFRHSSHTLWLGHQRYERSQGRTQKQTGSIGCCRFAGELYNAGPQGPEPPAAADLVSVLVKLHQHIRVGLWGPMCGSASRFAAQILAWETDITGYETPAKMGEEHQQVDTDLSDQGLLRVDGCSTAGSHPELDRQPHLWGRSLLAITLALTLAFHLSSCSPAHAHSPVQEPPCLVAPSPKRTKAASPAERIGTAGVTNLEAEVIRLKPDDNPQGLLPDVLESPEQQTLSIGGELSAPCSGGERFVSPTECPLTIDLGHSYHTTAPERVSSSASSASEQAADPHPNPSEVSNPVTLASLSALSHPPLAPQLKLPPWLTEARLQQFFSEAGEAWGRMNLTVSRSTIHAIARGWWFGLPQNIEISEQVSILPS